MTHCKLKSTIARITTRIASCCSLSYGNTVRKDDLMFILRNMSPLPRKCFSYFLAFIFRVLFKKYTSPKHCCCLKLFMVLLLYKSVHYEKKKKSGTVSYSFLPISHTSSFLCIPFILSSFCSRDVCSSPAIFSCSASFYTK